MVHSLKRRHRADLATRRDRAQGAIHRQGALVAGRNAPREAVFVYRDRDFEPSKAHLDGFGVLRADTSPKPVLDVIAA